MSGLPRQSEFQQHKAQTCKRKTSNSLEAIFQTMVEMMSNMLRNKTFGSLFPNVFIVAATLLAVAAIWTITHYQASIVMQPAPSNNDNAPHGRDTIDQARVTQWSLTEMENDIARYYQISDESEWAAISNVRTLDELWELLHQRYDIVGPLVPSPVPKNYITDNWNQPYQLNIKTHDDETVLRISSQGHGNEIYVELIFTRRKTRFFAKCSWADAPLTVP
jgi:hypothetical protein